MVSLWTSIPIKSVLDCDMVDLRVFWVDVATSSGTGFGKLTRVPSGVNLPPLEVIMSRHPGTFTVMTQKGVEGDTLYSSPHWCRIARGVCRSAEARRDQRRSPRRLHDG